MRVMMTVERYLALPIYAMERARPLFIDQLRILGIEDAEQKLPEAQEVAMAMAPPETEPTEAELNEAQPPLPINEEEQLDDEAVQMIEETEAEAVV